jgi:DNA polymerase III subunit delta'
MSLRDVLCQERAIGSLRKAVEGGRLAHAYIFAGEEGVGKFTTAREFARMLLCHNPTGSAAAPKAAAKRTAKTKPSKDLLFGAEPEEINTTPDSAAGATAQRDGCGHCESCRLIDAGTHPDFRIIAMALYRFSRDPTIRAKDSVTEIPTEVLREFFVEKVANCPVEGHSVVFVVKEAERMNEEGQNAILKVIEEPQQNRYIFLLSSKLNRLIPTIRSRCQVIRFGPVDETRIADRLVGQGVEKTEALFWARFSQGSLGVAQVWAGTNIGEPTLYQVKRELVDRLANLKAGEVLETAERIVKVAKEIAEAWEKGAENANKSDLQRKARKGLLRMIIGVYEDAMTSAVSPGRPMIHADQAGAIERIRQGRDAESLADGVEAGYEKLRWIESHVNERLIFEQYLFRLCGCDTIQFLSVE